MGFCSSCREIAGNCDYRTGRMVALALPTVITWGKARFSMEELREMAGGGVPHVKGDLHDAFLRFAKQAFRLIHPQIDVIARRRHARSTLEQATKMKLAQPGLSRQTVEVELLGNVFGHPVGDLAKLVTGQ